MKKLMTVLLGLSLVIGNATVAFSQGKEGQGDQKKETQKGKRKKGEGKKKDNPPKQ